MEVLLSARFFRLVCWSLLGGLVSSWSGYKLSFGARKSRLSGVGLPLRLGAFVALLLNPSWQAIVAFLLLSVISTPVLGYLAGLLFVATRQDAPLLTPTLAAKLSGGEPRSRGPEEQERRFKSVMDRIGDNPAYSAMFQFAGIPFAEVVRIHKAMWDVAGPNTADTVVSNSVPLNAYFRYLTASSHDHSIAAAAVARDLGNPGV